MVKIAVILSGCGHMDGSEIRESILTFLALEHNNIDYTIFAPDITQTEVYNHYAGQLMQNETRNVLVEAARIARGKISKFSELNSKDFSAIIMPGGYGVGKNLSTIADGGMEVLMKLKEIIIEFYESKKPIGGICLAPAVIALSLKDKVRPTLTLGDYNDLLEKFGADQKVAKVDEIVVDEKNKIVTTPAYMMPNPKLPDVESGIEKLVKKIKELCES